MPSLENFVRLHFVPVNLTSPEFLNDDSTFHHVRGARLRGSNTMLVALVGKLALH